MLTAERKAIVKSHLKYEPEILILNERRLRHKEQKLQQSSMLKKSKRKINYNFLSTLAKRFLCVTATNVPSERLFSSAGNLLSERRSRLTPENVEKLLFLYENDKLIIKV